MGFCTVSVESSLLSCVTPEKKSSIWPVANCSFTGQDGFKWFFFNSKIFWSSLNALRHINLQRSEFAYEPRCVSQYLIFLPWPSSNDWLNTSWKIHHYFLSPPLSLQKRLLRSFQVELRSWRRSNWMCPVSETPWHLPGMENAFFPKPVNSTSPPLWDHSTQPEVSHPIFIKPCCGVPVLWICSLKEPLPRDH